MIVRYRSTESLVVGWALLGVSVVILYALFSHDFSTTAFLIAILIALLAWLVAIRPAVIVHENALVIQNVLKRHEIPWASVSEISATLLLKIETEDGRRISAWAISSSGRARRRGEASRADVIVYELEEYRRTYGS